MSLLDNQETIGGPGVKVEIDDTLFVRTKDKGGKVWIFGGIERNSKKCFIVPIVDDCSLDKEVRSTWYSHLQ